MAFSRFVARVSLAGLLGAATLAAGCSAFSVPDMSFLKEPRFRSLIAALHVVGESPSRMPLFPAGSPSSEPRLAGIWVEEGDGAIWEFADAGAPDATYRLHISAHEFGSLGEFGGELDARVFWLGRYRFIEFEFVAHPDLVGEEEPPMRFFAFFQLAVGGDGVQLRGLSQDWLRASLDAGDISIAHEDRGATLIMLTAETAELRAFVLRFADNPAAFPEPSVHGPGFRLIRPLS